MRSLSLLIVLQLSFRGPAFARAHNEHRRAAHTAKTAARKSKRAAAPQTEARRAEAPAPRRIWLSLSLSNVFDTNVEHDERGIDSFGFVPTLGLHCQNDVEKPVLEFDYEVALHRYTRTNNFDRVSQSLAAVYRRTLTRRFSARTTGEVSLQGSSEDRDVNNQYGLEQQIQYRFNAANRVQAFAAYRVKRYPLIDVGKNAIDPYFGGKFLQRLAGGREWEISYRYDKNRAQDAKDRYVRWTYGAEFSTPLARTRQDLLTVGARYSPRLYARQIKLDDGARVPRHDRRWVFDAAYDRPLARDLRLGLSYRYETRGSNDPAKRFNAHLFGVTFNFKWWR